MFGVLRLRPNLRWRYANQVRAKPTEVIQRSALSVVQKVRVVFDLDSTPNKGLVFSAPSASSVVEDFSLGFAFSQRKALLCGPLRPLWWKILV